MRLFEGIYKEQAKLPKNLQQAVKNIYYNSEFRLSYTKSCRYTTVSLQTLRRIQRVDIEASAQDL